MAFADASREPPPADRRQSARLRFAVLATLYVAQAIPLGFFVVGLPAILRQRGVALERIGLVSVLALPFLLKFAWAPLVDRFDGGRLGPFRSWIVPLQLLSAASMVAIAGLDLERHFVPLLVLGAVFMLFAATQDVATDGLAVHLLSPGERGPGNGVQVGGYYLGQVLGGGLLLVLYARFGWRPALLAMAAMLAAPLLPLLRLREPRRPVAAPPRPGAGFGALGRFFRRPGAASWVAVLLLYRAGETMAVAMLNPLLVDRGLPLDRIGVLLGVGSSVGALAGALAGGVLVRPLGRQGALVVFGALQALAIGGYLVPALTDAALAAPALVAAVVIAGAFCGGMATAALYTTMMDACGRTSAASDFTLQQALAAVGPLVGASLSGVLASRLGYAGHFALCAALAVVAAALVAATLREGRAAAPAEGAAPSAVSS